MSEASNIPTTATAASTPALPSTTRRQMLAGSGLAAVTAALAVPAMVSPVHAATFDPARSPERQDADLIAACAAFANADQIYVNMGKGVSDDAFEAAHDRWHETLDALVAIKPRTLAGLKAKADAVIAAFKMDIPNNHLHETVEDLAQPHEVAAWRLLHDVLAMGGAA